MQQRPSRPSNASLEIVTRAGEPNFLGLDWDTPLREWSGPHLVDVARGVSRHVVRFVEIEGTVYAIKETTPEMATHEYQLLRALSDRRLPVVDAVGVVRNRAVSVRFGGSESQDEPDDGRIAPPAAALITRHLSFSMPFRYLFQGRPVANLRSQLLDSLAVLLVRMHLEGFFWGDCSLSNTLFRRDAGALTAYLVDAETGNLSEHRISDGQRSHDLSIATENVGGELLDLEAGGLLKSDIDIEAVSEEIRFRYDRLWQELNAEQIIDVGDRRELAQRIRRLNDLGFDVGEFRTRTTDDNNKVRVVPKVVEVGHHLRRLQQLTGLVVDENQARRLLNDIDEHRAMLEVERGALPEAMAAYDWLTAVYNPVIGSIPEELRSRLPDAEAFHQILEHRWYLSETAQHDVGLEEATRAYIIDILRFAPVEEAILPLPDEETRDLASDLN
jgi:Domain of unknown function (DUF4032)